MTTQRTGTIEDRASTPTHTDRAGRRSVARPITRGHPRRPVARGGLPVLVLAALLGGASHAEAQPRYAAVWPAIAPGVGSSARGVNSLGQIVGLYNVPNSQQAFLWSPSDGLHTLAGAGGVATGINDAGQIAGYKFDDVVNPDNGQTYSRQHAVWWTLATGAHALGSGWPANGAHAISAGGRLVGVSDTGSPVWAIGGGNLDMGLPPGAVAHAISPNGQIVVGSLDTGSAFLWTAAGGMQDLGTMGGQAVGPRGVNDHGQVVGIVSIGGNANAFSWTSTGGVRLIDPLGHVWSYALAINNAGVIVGSLFGTSAYGVPDMAFIEVDSVTYNLNTLIVPNNGPYLQFANAISEDGRIAGDAAGGGVFVLTPCLGNALVEPSTTSICPSGTATFSVTAAGTGPFSYQWQVADPAANGGWTNIADGTMLWNGDAIAQFRSGNPAVLSVELFFDTYEQGRSVRCIVSNACGSVTSDSATLTVCRADFNCSGNTDGDDLFDFLDAWFAQNGSSGSGLSADIDSSGTVDSDDLFAFLDLWFAENGNCP